MSIKINRLKLNSHPQIPVKPDRASRKADLWRAITHDPILSKYIRPDHPFFVFDPLALSDCLSFRLSVKGCDESVTALAFAIDLKGTLGAIEEEKRCKAGVMSAVRTLLFYEIGESLIDARLALDLITPDGLDWVQIAHFIQACLYLLPVSPSFENGKYAMDVFIAPIQAPDAPQFSPVRLRLSKGAIEANYTRTEQEPELQDYLMIYLCRVLMGLMSPEQAQRIEDHGQAVADNIQAAKDMLQATRGAEPPAARPTLALCMIVRNEADCLARCLHSVQGLVDEIVIVDTGSTDNTREIANGFDARIFSHPWQNDFASARNAALDRVTSDWVLVLDADEVLTHGADFLRGFIEHGRHSSTPIAYELKINNLGPDGDQANGLTHYTPRLFERRHGLRYAGIIHEQLTLPDGSTPALQALSYIEIEHEGYTEAKMAGKRDRNFNLLKQAIESEPERAFHWFNFGVGSREAGDNENAVKAFRQCVILCQDESAPYLPACYTYLANAFVDLERYQDALTICQNAPESAKEMPDLWLAAGWALLKLDDPMTSIVHFNTAKGIAGPVSVTDKAASTWKPLLGLYRAYKALSEDAQALDALNQALAICPNNPLIQAALEQEATYGIAR